MVDSNDRERIKYVREEGEGERRERRGEEGEEGEEIEKRGEQ